MKASPTFELKVQKSITAPGQEKAPGQQTGAPGFGVAFAANATSFAARAIASTALGVTALTLLTALTTACATNKTTGHDFITSEAAKAQETSAAKDCDGTPNGVAVWGYQQPTAAHGSMCIPSTKTCLDGTWTGPEVFAACRELPE